jgi:hypothetical protein
MHWDEGLGVAMAMALFLMHFGHRVHAAKRDVNRAFRQLPLDVAMYGDLLWVVFWYK